MIGYIKGKVISFEDGVVVLENNGIGYEVTCVNSVYQKLLSDGEGEVFVYTSVKEDGITLYGFGNMKEKSVFLKLITVSGVGPKMAVGILSGMSIDQLTVAIATGDVKAISTIKGLGKKTAERIILELQDKLGTGDVTITNAKQTVTVDKDAEETIQALMSLGFTRSESMRAVQIAMDNGAKGVEQILALAIKNIK